MQTRRLLERGSVAERIAKGQAEKAQKAEAALRAEDGQRCAENGPALGLHLVLDHRYKPREHPLAQQ